VLHGHTLGPVIADLEKVTGVAGCIHLDKSYRGDNHPDRFKITGQIRRVTQGRPPGSASPSRYGAGDRASKGRPLPPQGPRRRPDQCRPGRRRLQFQPTRRWVEQLLLRALLPILGRGTSPPTFHLSRRSETFLADDYFFPFLNYARRL
jgi:hypothetical protein